MSKILKEETNYEIIGEIMLNQEYENPKLIIKSKTEPKIEILELTIEDGNWQNYIIIPL